MLRNNLIIAWRNLMRHRLHTVINLAGLSLGMAFCLSGVNHRRLKEAACP